MQRDDFMPKQVVPRRNAGGQVEGDLSAILDETIDAPLSGRIQTVLVNLEPL